MGDGSMGAHGDCAQHRIAAHTRRRWTRGRIATLSLTTALASVTATLLTTVRTAGHQYRAAAADVAKSAIARPPTSTPWRLVWREEFNGATNTGVDTQEWIYDIGTQYPGGPPQWGTGEVETMSSSTENVYQDGVGHLVIKPIHSGNSPLVGWTSGRIETQKIFDAPPKGALAIEVSVQQPDISGAAAAGYWPAVWALGAPFRGNYQNWPSIGEMDIVEDVNGLSSEWATLHCGTLAPPNPCNEFTGISSGQRECVGCQTEFHTYRVELDRSVSPQEIRWYLDGLMFFTVTSAQVDPTTWANATDHGFFVILDVAMGGGFPNAVAGSVTPTNSTVSGVPMVVDYVRVYKRPVPDGDFDSDGKSDRTIFRPSTGVWYAALTNGGARATAWGVYTDLDVAADYDGDGTADIAVWRPSTGQWFIVQSATSTVRVDGWGVSSDMPLGGDVDGDGKADLVVWRPSTGTWFAKESTGGTLVGSWGVNGDQPLLGDFDGDGKADFTIYRSGVWYALLSGGGSTAIAWGVAGDIPVQGDWDGDGKADAGIFRPGTGQWFVKQSSGGIAGVAWGVAGDIPLSGDHDGDGKSDYILWRPSTGVWYTQFAAGGSAAVGWGTAGDRPVGRVPGS